MKEDVKVDWKGFQEQNKKEILDGGRYCRLEIIVGKNADIPVVEFNALKVGRREVSELLASAKTSLNALAREFPLEAMMADLLSQDSEVTTIKENGESK